MLRNNYCPWDCVGDTKYSFIIDNIDIPKQNSQILPKFKLSIHKIRKIVIHNFQKFICNTYSASRAD